MRHHLRNILSVVSCKTQDPNPEIPEHNQTSEPNTTPTHIPYPKPTPNPNPNLDVDMDDIHTDVLYNSLIGIEENLTDNETKTDINMNSY